MGYTSLDALAKRLKSQSLAALAHDGAGEPDITNENTIAVINQAIDDATDTINSYLYGHIDMTDATNTAAVEYRAAIIALYVLYQRRYMAHASNPMAKAYDDTVDWLKAMARGKLHTQGDPQHPDGQFYSTTEDSDKKFTDDALTRF